LDVTILYFEKVNKVFRQITW